MSHLCWALSVLMLSRQTLVPDSTDAISASMPRSRNERKCPAATPRGGETSLASVLTVNPKRASLFYLYYICLSFFWFKDFICIFDCYFSFFVEVNSYILHKINCFRWENIFSTSKCLALKLCK